MKPRDILNVAEDLITGTREAEWRTAVGRAYYAAFHTAREVLLQGGFRVPLTEQAHVYLQRRLANCRHPDVENAGRELNQLRFVRNLADYDLQAFLDHTTALDYVQLAEAIVQLLETVATEPAVLTRITDAMKVYERDVLRDVTWHP